MCLFLYFCFCCLFFFKQKTAYEMRISDWSSDVCSSDLGSSASTTWSGIRVSAVTALLLGTSIPSMVFAQTIAEAPAASDDSTGLQDIVVTARRKEERLRDVPIS